MAKSKNYHKFGYKEEHFDAEEELSWMDYSGILDMEVEFISDLGETELSLAEILKLEKGSIIDLKKVQRNVPNLSHLQSIH